MKKRTAVITAMLLAVGLAGCTASKAVTETNGSGGNIIVAAKTTAKVTVDGLAGESAWQAAEGKTIKLDAEPGVEPKEITLRAIYNGSNIYLLAKYKDSTPLKIGETWTFDGTGWTKGAYDDSLAFIWNINDSVKGFNTQGMKVMTKPLTNGTDIYDFAINTAASSYCAAGDINQKADIWGWCGMPEFYGKADDMFFSKQAAPGPVQIAVQHDGFTDGKPWIKNETNVAGKAAPIYQYKEGLNTENTPRPYMEDVVAITDYTAFKAGDKAPYVVGIKGATWGGSKDDILVKGARQSGDWSVEFARPLNTGNKDDIRLEPGKTATFVVIIRDDGKGYAISAPVEIRID